MLPSIPFVELYAPFAAGILGILLAVGLLFARSVPRGWFRLAAGLLTLGVLAGTAVLAARSGWPRVAWVPLAVVALLWGLGLGLRTAVGRRVVEWSSRVVVRGEFHAVVLLLGGLGIIVAQAWSLDRAAEDEVLDAMEALEFERSDIRPLPWSARTDRGSAVVLHAPSDPSLDAVDDRRERQYLTNRAWDLQIIRTAESRPESNCHGWVFTGGRFWIRSNQVDQILAENGYQEVDDPRLGDLVIYRNEKGDITHTGVVGSRGANGFLLVEGKWGRMGRYLHRPQDQPYGNTWKFYRSARNGHLLKGVDAAPDPTYPLPISE
jgi:hypothetical protein